MAYLSPDVRKLVTGRPFPWTMRTDRRSIQSPPTGTSDATEDMDRRMPTGSDGRNPPDMHIPSLFRNRWTFYSWSWTYTTRTLSPSET